MSHYYFGTIVHLLEFIPRLPIDIGLDHIRSQVWSHMKGGRKVGQSLLGESPETVQRK